MRVTPSWIEIDGTSHAVRTVVRLRRVHRARERASWRALCATLVALALVALAVLLREGLPFAIAWGAFAVALALALLAAWYGFVANDAWAVEIGLAGGESLEVTAGSAAQLERLHAALAGALDWHAGTHVAASGGAIAAAPAPLAASPAASGARTDAPRDRASPPATGTAAPPTPEPASGPSDRRVVRVVDRQGRVVGEGPIAIDASR